MRGGRTYGINAGLAIFAGVMFGAAAGIGFYTFVYAEGGSYMTNDPEACANCHIMRNHYDAWRVSSHHTVAVCNDCHTPEHLVPKYWVKANNGFWHSFKFTAQNFHEPLRMRDVNVPVTEAACRRCHAEIVESIEGVHAQGDLACIRCHETVGHME
jgi:cytochrome c nitrite reductase small subunit